MRKTLFHSWLIPSGCLIFLFSLFSEFLFDGSPDIGISQLTGMTSGLGFILIGLKYGLSPGQPRWTWSLFVIYLSVILVAGLRSVSLPFWLRNHHGIPSEVNIYSHSDLALNVVGFLPMGFFIALLLRPIVSNNKTIRLFAAAALLGFSVSFIIELSQYLWVSGRIPSVFDLAANTCGAIIGAACYLFLRRRRLIT